MSNSKIEESGPYQDGPGVVFPFDDVDKRDIIIEIIREVSGMEPALRRDTDAAKRALYPQNMPTRMIINWSAPHILERLGHPTAVLTLVSDNPREGAEEAVAIFTAHAVNAEMVDGRDVELDTPKDFMFFVLTDGEFLPLLVWPRNPTQEQLANIQLPQPWND